MSAWRAQWLFGLAERVTCLVLVWLALETPKALHVLAAFQLLVIALASTGAYVLWTKEKARERELAVSRARAPNAFVFVRVEHDAQLPAVLIADNGDGTWRAAVASVGERNVETDAIVAMPYPVALADPSGPA